MFEEGVLCDLTSFWYFSPFTMTLSDTTPVLIGPHWILYTVMSTGSFVTTSTGSSHSRNTDRFPGMIVCSIMVTLLNEATAKEKATWLIVQAMQHY